MTSSICHPKFKMYSDLDKIWSINVVNKQNLACKIGGWNELNRSPQTPPEQTHPTYIFLVKKSDTEKIS